MKRYTLAVTSPEYWSEIHDALIVDSNQDGIPDRKITCSDCKDHSLTRGTYELTEAEASEIGNHPHVKWIELSHSDNPGYYPNPVPLTKRFPKDVKIYRSLLAYAPPSTPTSADENRTNWAVKRVGVHTNGDGWPNDTFSINTTTGNIDFSLTGKNVDVIIMDSGVMQYHPEFLDANGQSRVRDIILDGPYFIDPAYFNSNGHTYTKPDGRTGISTTSAHAWWENSSSRSGSFSSIGTVSVPTAYTEPNALGIGGTIHSMTSTHGTRCASLASGRNYGLAFESNIWTISIFSPANIDTDQAYDAMKIFHLYKTVNTTTNRKNPTVLNSSWGYNAGITSSSTVNYKFAGDTGSFTGDDGFDTSTTSANLVKAMKEGFGNGYTNNHRSWCSSSRSNSTDTAGDELMAAGIIHVAAASNDNQRMGIGADDPHRLDYLSDTYFGSTDPRSDFPSGTVPCGHRDWLNPSGIGFDSATDFHPTICVGAIDDAVNGDYSEYKASYSNNGPGIDVWAPADATLAASMKSSTGADLSSAPYYERYNSDFVDQYMNGTSAASPVTAGLIALHLESVPSATSREVKKFLSEQGSIIVPDSLFEDTNPSIGTTGYWYTSYNLRGAQRRILRDLSASPTEPSISVSSDIISQNLVCHLDAGNSSSYSGIGTTWSDISGSSNNFTLVNSPSFSSANGGLIDFDGTDDYATSATDETDFQWGTGAFSYGLWVKFDSFTNSNSSPSVGLMAGFGDNGNTTEGSWQLYYSSNKIRHIVYLGGTSHLIGGSTDINLNTWYYIVYVNPQESSGNVTKLYLNGSLEASNTLSASNYGSALRFIYLASTRGSRFTNCKIGAVHVYKGKALSQAEILHNYDTTKGRFEQRPLIISGISFKQS